VCLLWVSGAGAQGGDEPVGLTEYRARLDQVIQALEKAPAGEALPALEAAQRELAALRVVELPSGDTIEVQSPLTSSLDQVEALARLRLLRDQLSAAANDNTAARLARLRAILERPDFAVRGPQSSLLERILAWLRDRLPDGLLGLPGGLASTVGAMIVVAGLVFIAVLLSYWLQGFLRGFVANAEARRRQDNGDDVPLTAAAARQQASALAQAGSYRQAMRQLYLAALLRLDEVGALRYDRSQTNREVLAQLPATSTTHHHLAPVVDTFDRIWYGVREPDGATYASYAAEVDWLTTSVEPAASARDEGPA
jgi:hypothetical protein